MFVRVIPKASDTVVIRFEGCPLHVAKGMSVAVALLETGISHFRDTPETASPRAPYCLMGVCFDCLMVIDGVANRQACMIEVAEGMTIARQSQSSGALDA